jgi:ribose 5-phosphate isomerase B
MLSLGERLVSEEAAVAILDAWLAGQFEGGRHQRRIAMIDEA